MSRAPRLVRLLLASFLACLEAQVRDVGAHPTSDASETGDALGPADLLARIDALHAALDRRLLVVSQMGTFKPKVFMVATRAEAIEHVNHVRSFLGRIMWRSSPCVIMYHLRGGEITDPEPLWYHAKYVKFNEAGGGSMATVSDDPEAHFSPEELGVVIERDLAGGFRALGEPHFDAWRRWEADEKVLHGRRLGQHLPQHLPQHTVRQHLAREGSPPPPISPLAQLSPTATPQRDSRTTSGESQVVPRDEHEVRAPAPMHHARAPAPCARHFVDMACA